MGVLKNQRHELFAQGLAKGMTAEAAYVQAGYKPDRRNTPRLTTNQDIRRRVEELQERAARRVELDRAEVLRRLERNAEDAYKAGEFPASNQALIAIGKELGMFVEKRQVEDVTDRAVPGTTDGTEQLRAAGKVLRGAFAGKS